ncbi:DUF2007 domain-containing protein [Luteolibacter algae]|uniref:DUF2007 domain-containing protein n=1 Tax=Luteolibacter algae TaxID=454151 RepID=A0ABW5D8H3_9BACT
MKELFRERDLARISYYQSLLEYAGIATFIKNENLSTTEGFSIPDYFPALCVVHDEDFDAAQSCIRQNLMENQKASETEILCPSCGEKSPGNFACCWNCEAALAPPDSQRG